MSDIETIRRLKSARADYGEWSGAAEELRRIFPPTGRHRINRDGRRIGRDGRIKPRTKIKSRKLPRRARRVVRRAA